MRFAAILILLVFAVGGGAIIMQRPDRPDYSVPLGAHDPVDAMKAYRAELPPTKLPEPPEAPWAFKQLHEGPEQPEPAADHRLEGI
jgi:hypothetical protein